MTDAHVFDLDFKRALIVGSTGLVGGYLLRDLIHHSKFNAVHSLSRRPSGLDSPTLKAHLIDFDQIDTLDATTHGFDADALFIALGTTRKAAGSKAQFRKVDFEYPLTIARKARAAGCDACHVVSAMGADAQSNIFYNRVKGELEDALKSLGFPQLYIYRPSILMGPRQEQRIGEQIGKTVMTALSPLMLGPLKTYRPIHATTVADAMLQNAVNGTNGVHILSSDAIKTGVKKRETAQP